MKLPLWFDLREPGQGRRLHPRGRADWTWPRCRADQWIAPAIKPPWLWRDYSHWHFEVRGDTISVFDQLACRAAWAVYEEQQNLIPKP